MRVVVPMKAVPDLVEELELRPDGTGIDREYLKFVLNEWDDQALEEALLVKETGGVEVVAVGVASDPDIEQALYSALAKGADSAVKLSDGTEQGAGMDSHQRAALLAAWLRDNPADLVITGVQAPDDLDGQLAPLLAAQLDQPHVSVVTSVVPEGGGVLVRQEFSGGRSAELLIQTPAVVGLQAARQAPRYASITRIRQMMQAGGIQSYDLTPATSPSGITVRRMYAPEATSHAEMISGSPIEVADRIVALLSDRGLVKG